MKVLYINTQFQGGGAERVARQLYEGMGAKGVETFMMVGREEKPDPRYERIYETSFRKKTNWIYSKMTINARERDSFAQKKILSYIHRNQIDLVHIHNSHGNYMGMEDVGEIAKVCKVVWTLHDMWTFTGHCAYAGDCMGWRDRECRHCEDLSMHPRIYYDCARKFYLRKQRHFTGKGITFVTPSDWLYRQVKRSLLGTEDVRLIQNGVNIHAFYPGDKEKIREKYGLATEKKVLLFLTNMLRNTMKGFSYLAEALRNLEHKEDYLLLIVGKVEEIQDLCQMYETKTFGYVKEVEKLRDIYAMADLFLVPSMLENFPCVTLEAMACGVPVAAFATGGIVEQLDEETGWLVERGNAAALCKAIEEACREPEVLERKGRQCRKKVEECFSEELMLERYGRLYQEALDGKEIVEPGGGVRI